MRSGCLPDGWVLWDSFRKNTVDGVRGVGGVGPGPGFQSCLRPGGLALGQHTSSACAPGPSLSRRLGGDGGLDYRHSNGWEWRRCWKGLTPSGANTVGSARSACWEVMCFLLWVPRSSLHWAPCWWEAGAAVRPGPWWEPRVLPEGRRGWRADGSTVSVGDGQGLSRSQKAEK